METICPGCDKEITPLRLTERRIYRYNNCPVEIEDKFYRCSNCGVEWSVENFDFLAEVYRVYNEKVG